MTKTAVAKPAMKKTAAAKPAMKKKTIAKPAILKAPSKPKKTVTAKPAMKKKPDNNCQAMLAPDEPVDVASMPIMRMYTRQWSTIHVGPYRLWKLDSLDWNKRTATVTETWVPSRSHS